ncbi:MAG TPA: hypothetical protein VHX86_10570 [Tepidisphaeraceae bacterium]|jgi:hypothetical protein|nr:hypothetical protein [Tepidisphaeraceae bacterium]
MSTDTTDATCDIALAATIISLRHTLARAMGDATTACDQCARRQATAPPLAASSGNTDSGPTFWNTDLGLITAVGIPLVLILGIAIGWASWSAHSRQQVARHISDIQQEAAQLLTAGDASGASQKYASVLKYMDSNDVTDDDTRNEVLEEKAHADAKVAQIAAADAAKQIAQHVSEMRQEAARLLTAGDPIGASQEYAQLVNYMDNNGFTNNDTRSEVLQEKANADAKSAPILAANAEEQRLKDEAAAQRAAADAAKQQEEEQAAEAVRQREQAAAEEAAEQQREQAAIQARSHDAYTMSQEFVKDQLKSPATAQFQPFDSPKVSVTYSDGWYTVYAVVDAQNGFGALIRSSYICKLKPIGGDQWQADSTDILDN